MENKDDDDDETSVGPFYGWPSQLREQLHSRTKTQVPVPISPLMRKIRRADTPTFPPAETSQSPVDNPNKERGERWFSMSMLPQCCNAMEPAVTADGSP
jgi:hypothetical protein